jgi:hypothetical protein
VIIMQNNPAKPVEVRPIGVLINMAFISAFALLFNIFPEKVGVLRSAMDPSSFTPLLGAGYKIYMPALNLWWGMAFALNAYYLFTARRTSTTRWLGVSLNVYLVILLIWMSLGGANFLTPAAMLWFRPLIGLLGLAVLLKAYWQIRFVAPRPAAP